MIRKLGKTESLISQRGRKFSRSLRVTTDLDLLTRPSLLNKIIRQWMSLHPFLRARIDRTNGASYFVLDQSTDDQERWLDSVKYLWVKPNMDPERVFDDLSYLVCEKELSSGYSSRLMWSLVILELAKDSTTITREFEIILTMNHTISEGRNSHILLLQLLDLIEYNWFLDSSLQPQRLPKEYTVVPSVDELYFAISDQSTPSEHLPAGPKPSQIKPLRKRCPPMSYNWSDHLGKDWIYLISSEGKRPFIQLGQLVNDSQKICFKSRRLTWSKKIKSRLVHRCKQEKATVTCFLANLTVWSLRQLDLQMDNIVSIIPISLRQFEPVSQSSKYTEEFKDQFTMGYYGSALKLLKEPSVLNDQNMWPDSRTDTLRLRQMIEKKEMFTEDRPSESGVSFVLSNLGVVPARLPHSFFSPQQQFNIKQAFTEQEIDPEDHLIIGPACLHVSTCNGCLNASFLYNSFVLSHSQADSFLKYFLGAFDKMLETT